jgi:hypothetical protein
VGTPTDLWKEKIGSRPTVTVYERPDRGMAIYAKWPVGKSYRKRALSVGSIRDGAGKIDPNLKEAAFLEAVRLRSKIVAGDTDPAVGTDIPPETPSQPLTLKEGFDAFLHPEHGHFVTRKSQHAVDTARNAETILRILKPDTPWERVTGQTYRKLWRALAREHLADGRHGFNAAKKICITFRTAAVFLADEHLPLGTAMPMPKWRSKLRQEWMEMTDQREADLTADGPRHTPEEAGQIFRVLKDADPRIRLAVELGAADRLGQLLRCTRTDLNLDESIHPLGDLTIPGRGKKSGGTNALTKTQRDRVDADLSTGHLSLLEAAFQAGTISNYPLFPQGRLWKGKFRVTTATKPPMAKTTLLTLFRDLEALAGVESKPERGWYGLRRVFADLAEDVTSDERALNHITKHEGSDMRRKRYQERERPRITRAASETVAAVRRKVLSGDAGADDDTPETAPEAGKTYPSDLTQPEKTGNTQDRSDPTNIDESIT